MNKQIVTAQRKILATKYSAPALLAGCRESPCADRVGRSMGQSRTQAQEVARPARPQKDWLLRFLLLLARMPVKTVLVDGFASVCENIPVEEVPYPARITHFGDGLQARPIRGLTLLRVLIESRRQALDIITHAEINCQLAGEGPMILNESRETRYRKIHVRIPERLSKLTKDVPEEIAERAKEIHAIKAVRYVGPQSDRFTVPPTFQRCFPRVREYRIAGLIMVFATLAVPRIGPPKVTSPATSISGPKRLIRAQDCMAVAA